MWFRRYLTRRCLLWAAALTVVGVALAFGWRRWAAATTAGIAAACRESIQNEDWDSARVLADQWARRAPEDASAWISLADVARSQGDLSATAESLRRVPPTDRRYLKVQALRADLLLDGLGRPHEAIGVWQEMLQVSPGNEVAHQRLIYVYAMTLQRQSLTRQIRASIQKQAEPPEAYGYLLAAPALVFSDGYHRIGQWLAQSPGDETLKVARAVFAARTNPSRGLKMFGSADSQAGDLNLILEAQREYPQNLEILAFFIERAIMAGQLDEVGRLLQNLPVAAEEDGRFWRYLGTWHDSQRRLDDAATAFQKSIELHPMDWRSHHELAAVERSRNRADLAARHAELGVRGKLLERQILELPNAAQADRELYSSLQRYAADCGDEEASRGLALRLGIAGQSR